MNSLDDRSLYGDSGIFGGCESCLVEELLEDVEEGILSSQSSGDGAG